jgi:hypothetical protein
MSEVGVSGFTPRVGGSLKTFDRMLPRGGIETERRFTHTSYKLLHIDVNDVGPSVQEEIKQTFRKDFDQYGVSIEHIPTGVEIGRQFRVYDIKDSNIVAVRSFHEMLDNPHGYGIGDFLAMTFVLPEFHQSYLLRAAEADLFHIAFKAGLMRRIYAYIKMQDSVQPETEPNPWKRIDEGVVRCLGKTFKSNTPEVQKYISISKTLDTEKGRFSIFEVNGDIYNGMDLKDYYTTACSDWSWANLDDLLSSLDSHADRVRTSARFGFVRRRP